MFHLLSNTFRHHSKVVLVVCLTIATVLVNVSLLHDAHKMREVLRRNDYKPSRPLESFSLIGPDYPSNLPVQRPKVRATVEESVHFTIANPESASEYLWTAPYGDNHIRLGPEMRALAVAMFHQLHCLRGTQSALMKGWGQMRPGAREHLHHCFNYIRQWTLCDADVTLEPGDFTQRNFTVERIGATHTCVDWQPIYDMVNDRWFKWEQYRVEHGVPLNDELKAAM